MPRIYEALATAIDARENCAERGNHEWELRWQERIDQLMKLLPSGSGVDNGTQLDGTRRGSLVLSCEFHHMSEHGYYDGWTHHRIIVEPSLALGAVVTVTGKDRNGILEYLGDLYHEALFAEAPPAPWDLTITAGNQT